MDLKHGDIVTVAPSGDFGKPRPALIIQSRIYDETEVVTLVLITSSDWSLPDVRVPIARSSESGLERDSFVMVDMVQTYRRTKIKQRIGRADHATLLRVREALVIFLGIDSDA